MQSRADVLVVGGGIIGSSIAFSLTAAGNRRVVLCEQGRIPGIGATQKSGGLIRMHHTNRWQARLAWQSYATYANWPDIVGGECGFHQTGFAMVVGPAHVSNLRYNSQMLSDLGIPLLVLSPGEFRNVQPLCNLEGIGAVAYEPFSGYADPSLASASFLASARQKGLRVMEGTQVTGLLFDAGTVTGVRTNVGTIHAETVVVASSFWAVRLLADLGVDLPIVPRQIALCYLAWDAAAHAPLCTYIDDAIGTYFRPAAGQQLLVGAGVKDHDPTDPTGELVQADALQEAWSRVQTRLPALRAAKPAGAWVGPDGYTPDKHAIIGRVGGWSGLYLAAGFSGGGFKVAPAIGQAAATEILDGMSAPELERFRLERFATGDLIKPEHPYDQM